MLLGGHQRTVPVLHLPGGDLKVEAGATSAVKATTNFQYQGVTVGALLHGEVIEVVAEQRVFLGQMGHQWKSPHARLPAGEYRDALLPTLSSYMKETLHKRAC